MRLKGGRGRLHHAVKATVHSTSTAAVRPLRPFKCILGVKGGVAVGVGGQGGWGAVPVANALDTSAPNNYSHRESRVSIGCAACAPFFLLCAVMSYNRTES